MEKDTFIAKYSVVGDPGALVAIELALRKFSKMAEIKLDSIDFYDKEPEEITKQSEEAP